VRGHAVIVPKIAKVAISKIVPFSVAPITDCPLARSLYPKLQGMHSNFWMKRV
jgi:hypothetical protein